uniref:ARAD1A13970p n=1 Tax=Blastobotrys adeninivorans TaxID=409370 RepID=A0A060SY61_BLAAD
MSIQKGNGNPAGNELFEPLKHGALLLAICRGVIWLVYPSAIFAVMLRADVDGAVMKTVLWTILPTCLGSVAQFAIWKPTGESIDGKGMLLRSLIGASIANFAIGFARNNFWVSCASFLIGLSLDNGVEMSRMSEELVGRHSAQKAADLPAYAFTICLFSGMLIEFLLRDPATRFPDYFGSSWLFGYFPNLLPSLCLIPFLVAAGVCLTKICGHLKHSKES